MPAKNVIKKMPKIVQDKTPEKKKKVVKTKVLPNVYIPSGCTLTDLGCTDTLKGFCPAGHTVNIIGDRNAGKTALSLASMAETEYRRPKYFKMKFIDYEQAMSFDIKKLYGENFHKVFELQTPEDTLEWAIENIATRIVEEVKSGPHFYVIDSAEVMKPKEEIELILAGLPVEAKPYGGPRSKAMTAFFRTVCPAIANSGSFMIVLSQAKDNMGSFDAKFIKKYRAGGRALAFYAYVEMWVAPAGEIKSGGLKIGAWARAISERSKCNGKKRDALFPILPAYGVDDLRGNIEWLIEKKVLARHEGITIEAAKKMSKNGPKVEPIKKGSIDLSNIGLDYIGLNPYLFIEENGHNEVVLGAVKSMWDAIEADIIEKTFGGRKGRYS